MPVMPLFCNSAVLQVSVDDSYFGDRRFDSDVDRYSLCYSTVEPSD